MKKILVTGFEPMYRFWDINPSWEVVSKLPEEIEGVQIVKARLPIVYALAEETLDKLVAEHQPDALVSLGQSGADNAIAMEMLGINMDDCAVPDNNGDLREGVKIREDGPDAYFTTLPCRKMKDAIENAGVPALLSYYAGGHLCNHVTYYGRYLAETMCLKMLSGFIHIPLDLSQIMEKRIDRRSAYAFDQNVTRKGIEAALACIAETLKSQM